MSQQILDNTENKAVRWVLQNTHVALMRADGVILDVTAREIVGAEFKGKNIIQNMYIPNTPSQDLAHLHFHRFPLQLKLDVNLTTQYSVVNAVITMKGFNADYSLEMDQVPHDQIVTTKGWFSVDTNSLDNINESLSNASIQSLGCITLRMYLDLIKSGGAHIFFHSSVESNRKHTASESEKCLPSSFTGSLYPYQEEGVAWLRSIAKEGLGCVLADEMGLGKTVQIIVHILCEIEKGESSSLIIAPTTLLENWRREFIKFSLSVRVGIHRGAGRTGFPSKLSLYDVVITSYETAVRDVSLLKMINWDVIVLDEAQAIKNSHTQRALTIKEIDCKMGIAVTGTPLENRLNDIWSIMDFACPGLLGSEEAFEKSYFDDIDSALSLEPIISPLMLRRLVSEVAKDLPERIDIPQAVSLSDESASIYESMRKEILDEYGQAGSLVALLKLRMYCTHPFLVTEGHGDPAVYSTKYVRLLEVLNEIFLVNQKAIIFTSYTKMSDILFDDLQNRFSIMCKVIDGRTPVEDRQAVVDQFQSVIGSAILILNPRAAGTGLNITAANHVIHYNLEWNPAIEDQASARAYRRGQKNPVTVHRFYHPGTVEEVIDERVIYKRQLSNAAVVGTHGDDTDLTYIARALHLSPLLNSEGIP